jgi:hypothetical protein
MNRIHKQNYKQIKPEFKPKNICKITYIDLYNLSLSCILVLKLIKSNRLNV